MNRVLDFLRGQRVAPPDASDRQLLALFRLARDETAFAELVRRYGPLVWGACRRSLASPHDAEDAFQATFLVLVRRANRLGADVPLGPWLHRVAVMTARNVLRGNRRRAAVTGPLEHEPTSAAVEPDLTLIDLDAALLALPERYRTPVVLCHLQGLTRREAAARLGCPEGTLSSLLNRALGRLRSRLGSAVPALLAVAATTVVPPTLTAATVRSAAVYTTSTLTAAGVSPAVADLTDGVLRMFWVKKLTAGLVLALVVTGGLFAGLAGRSGEVARATEPLAGEPQAKPDSDDAAKRLEKRVADLQKQKEVLDAMLADLATEQAKLEEVKRMKAAKEAAIELGTDVAVSIGAGNPSGYTYTVREVVGGKVAEVHTSDLDILRTYLTRAFGDPKGPKKLRLSADKDHPLADLKQVFAACAEAGYSKATFSQTERPKYRAVARSVLLYHYDYSRSLGGEKVETPPKPGEIDLSKYAEPKKGR